MATKGDGVVEVELRERPTMRVEVGGESFEARLGDLSYLPHAIEALGRFREVAAAAGDPDAALAAVEAFSGAASRMCESLLGEDSWRRIVPEGRDLDVWLVADVVSGLCEVASSDRFAEAVRQAWGCL